MPATIEPVNAPVQPVQPISQVAEATDAELEAQLAAYDAEEQPK